MRSTSENQIKFISKKLVRSFFIERKLDYLFSLLSADAYYLGSGKNMQAHNYLYYYTRFRGFVNTFLEIKFNCSAQSKDYDNNNSVNCSFDKISHLFSPFFSPFQL